MLLRRTTYSWFFVFIAIFTAVQSIYFALLMSDFLAHPFEPDFQFNSISFRILIALVIVPTGLLFAALVMRRAPGNVTGLFLILWTITVMDYTRRAEFPSLNIYSSTGWMGLWLLPLFFPDGRAFPRRYERWIQVLSVFTILSVQLWNFVQPTLQIYTEQGLITPTNPLLVPALLPLQPLVNIVENAAILVTMLLILPLIILRYRRSDYQVQQQIKWMLWLFATLVGFVLAITPSGLLQGDPYRLGAVGLPILAAIQLCLALIPYLAVGNAILRHRLYDIDIIIRRTLIYSILSAILALVFFGGVTVAQSLFRAATGQSSDLAIVVSTLAIAALFTPVRRRVQNVIDRRFYRRKYDAEKTLARFSQTLRDETDLAALQTSMISVVRDTMQPMHISLWIKGK